MSTSLFSSAGVLVLSTLSVLFIACNEHSSVLEEVSSSSHIISLEDTNGYDIRKSKPLHPSAYITQMCYTKTTDEENNTYNPCFACHNESLAPNYTLGDAELQEQYVFPSPALKNPFTNNFLDFSQRASEISNEEIISYVDESNYFDAKGEIILARKLNNLSPLWDEDNNSLWSGYVPECSYNFDTFGLDRDKDNQATGWVAFAYMPFLGTFFPTNGATDDVLIRLSDAFRVLSKESEFDADTYLLNLSIVESLIKRKNIAISPTDEFLYGVDLNKNGSLDLAQEIVFEWEPQAGKYMSYVGYAKELLESGKIHLAAGLYPEGTEFLHSVRYIKSDKKGEIELAPRMKELRYAKKTVWLTYADLLNKGMARVQEKDLNPDRLETFRGSMERGLGNNMGWIYQGFIEDKHGNLRPQSYEETLNCMGCHSGLSVTTDSTFSFARKLENEFQYGWYHPTQKSLRGIPENLLKNGEGELAHYLKENPYSDEFRENDAVYHKFHLSNGDLNQSMLELLKSDVTELLFPSHERALNLNRGYKAVVELQEFYKGKAGHIKPMKNVYKELEDGASTQLQRIKND